MPCQHPVQLQECLIRLLVSLRYNTSISRPKREKAFRLYLDVFVSCPDYFGLHNVHFRLWRLDFASVHAHGSRKDFAPASAGNCSGTPQSSHASPDKQPSHRQTQRQLPLLCCAAGQQALAVLHAYEPALAMCVLVGDAGPQDLAVVKSPYMVVQVSIALQQPRSCGEMHWMFADKLKGMNKQPTNWCLTCIHCTLCSMQAKCCALY